MSENDMIRRGEVLRTVETYFEGCYGDCTDRCRGCHAKKIADALRALPADPRAAAAVRLANFALNDDPWRNVGSKRWECDYCGAGGRWDNMVPLDQMVDPDTVLIHDPGCAWVEWRSLAKPEPAKCQQLPSSSHEASVPSNNSEPAPERCPEPGCVGGVVSFPCGSLPCNDPECVKLPCPRCAKGGAP